MSAAFMYLTGDFGVIGAKSDWEPPKYLLGDSLSACPHRREYQQGEA